MSSEQSSFRDMFEFPPEGSDLRQRKYGLKGVRNRKAQPDSSRPLKQSFYDIVQKAKNVAVFTQTLKQKIAEKRTLSQHTLKANELQFLENDSQQETANIYFAYHNKLVLAFEIAYLITIFIYLWSCTVEIVFGGLMRQPIIQVIVFFTHLTHIALFNFTQYKNQKFQFISNRNEVYSIYVSEKLIKDCIFLLMICLQLTPLDDSVAWPQVYIIIRVISLICYLELSQTCQKIEDLLSVSNQAESIISMLKLLYKIVLFLHFLSISLNLLAIVEAKNNVQSTWITQNGIDFHTNFDKYIVGWYWGATILSTVGFGEITPKNNYERFFISIVQVICCMTFGYFVNVIGSLIKLKAESEEKYEKQVRSLNRCLNFLTITNDLKHKIRTYYFNRHVIQQVYDPNQEKQVLESLAPNLQNALVEQNNSNVLSNSIIMQRFKKQTILKLTHMMKKIILAPENIIYSRNTKDRKLWFIERGEIEQFTDNFQNSTLRKKIASYNEKDTIVGWINFLVQNSYKTMAKAKIFTIAYELQECNFLSIVREDAKEYYRFLHMKQTLLEKKRKFLNKCISCDRFTHNVINCPRIHFVRKDIKKLATQHINLKKFIDQQTKTKKVDRSLIKYRWKARYSAYELEKEGSQVGSASKVENTTIQNFIKNMMFRQSALGFDKRKMSFMAVKRESKMVTEPKDEKDSVMDAKSNFSSDDIIEQEEELMFERVLICEDESKDYMPEHDVAKVLTAYANKYTKKMHLVDRIRNFMKKA